MMRTPLSATPESSVWSGLTSQSTPLHNSPLVKCSSVATALSHHQSTPQRRYLPTSKGTGSRLTPIRQYESKLFSSIHSPYQKSYTPLSATPGASPAFKTPIHITNSSSRSPHPSRTPIGSKLPRSAARKFITPQSQIVNPFEEALLSTYHGSVLSPGIFAVTDTPEVEGKGDRPFRWSIDQLAVLHPVDIEYEPSCEDHQKSRFNREVEETAQRAINKFFVHNNIFPSPFPTENGKPVFVAVPNTPSTNAGDLCNEGKAKPKQTQDAACQTTLTLPMDFDLQEVLGKFMTYQGSDDEGSTSSLRRKLFCQGEGTPSASPVKKVEDDFAMQCDGSPRLTPLKPFLLPQGMHLTPPHYSSSPITLSKTDRVGRMSEGMDELANQEFSPITLKQHAVLESSSSDNMCGSFMSSPMLPGPKRPTAKRKQHNVMASPDLSPICSGSRARSRLSLDMSPICSPWDVEDDQVNMKQSLSREGESKENIAVCTPYPACESTALSTPSTVGTPQAPENSILVAGTTLVTTPQFVDLVENNGLCDNPSSTKIQHGPHVGPAFQHPRLMMSDISMDVTDMETDYVAHSTGIPLQTNLMDGDEKSLRYPTSRDCSMLFEETTNPGSVGKVPTSQHSQDTGYQTCSLQLTNQETGLHTNLTQQFGSLPFKSYSEADCMEDEDSEREKLLPRAVIFKEKLDSANTSLVSRQLSYPPSNKTAFTQEKLVDLHSSSYLKTELEGCALIQEGLTEDQVIAKARYLLGQNISVTSAFPVKVESEKTSTSSQSKTTTCMPNLMWQPSCSSTPQKTDIRTYPGDSQRPSEVAKAVMKRAEDDLAKYSNLASEISST